jgi:hypothetical protein
MQEQRRIGPPEQTGQTELSPGGSQQITSSNDQIYVLACVIHHDGEVVGPIAQPVSQEEITALLRGLLRLGTQEPIYECLRPGLDRYPHA